LGKAIVDPEHPYVAVLGGAKVSDKIEVVSNLLPLVDSLGVATTYSLSATGELLSSRQGATLVRAKSLSEFSVGYYALGSNYLVSESTVASQARLVTVSLRAATQGQSVPFFSGAGLRNHE